MGKENVWSNSVLQYVTAESIVKENEQAIITAKNKSIRLFFQPSEIYLMSQIEGENYLINNRGGETALIGYERGWFLGKKGKDDLNAIEIRTTGDIEVDCQKEQTIVQIKSQECKVIRHGFRPHADFYGNQYHFSFKGSDILEKTLSEFYWGTLLPSVIEKTRAKDYQNWRGYVVSTLQTDKYSGTYPDVDHEFQCKGRLALSGKFELDVVKRMMELQFKLMKEDPIQMFRNPCAVQPDGTREYHVRRNSQDGKTNAEMFLVTGNIEILETAWLYIAATKDVVWLKEHIESLEGSASLIEHLTDESGRLWSDVYYEDQVIKDGMECMSAAMAANSYVKLAELEKLLGRKEMETHYKNQAKVLSETMVKPVPYGFWDEDKNRFVDWIDRAGEVHDHIHLLANSLPILFQYATKEQVTKVDQLIMENIGEFQRFPTFLAAQIEDYTDSEIGDGGPYDLCAAGRYWCWDAAYWAFKQNGEMINKQLHQVAEQAKLDEYKMGERYDMNHVYYQSDINWHGAAYYYEYPCVFSWVLIHDLLGIAYDIEVDLCITPRITTYGSVSMDSYQLEYQYSNEGFRLQNKSDKKRSFRIDLSSFGEKEARIVWLDGGAEVFVNL